MPWSYLSWLAFSLLIKIQNSLNKLNVDYFDLLMYKLVFWACLLIASSIIICITISYLLSLQINTPLQKIMKQLDKVEKGIYNPKNEWSTIFEFNALFDKFNSMIGGLREKETLKQKFGRYLQSRASWKRYCSKQRPSRARKKMSLFYIAIYVILLH